MESGNRASVSRSLFHALYMSHLFGAAPSVTARRGRRAARARRFRRGGRTRPAPGRRERTSSARRATNRGEGRSADHQWQSRAGPRCQSIVANCSRYVKMGDPWPRTKKYRELLAVLGEARARRGIGPHECRCRVTDQGRAGQPYGRGKALNDRSGQAGLVVPRVNRQSRSADRRSPPASSRRSSVSPAPSARRDPCLHVSELH